MATPVSTVISYPIDLLDYSGVAITGKTTSDFATRLAYLSTNVATTAAMTITELQGALAGLGKYLMQFNPGVIGIWDTLLIYNAGGVTRRFGPSFQVVTADQFDPIASTRAVRIDNLDAAVSTRAAAADYTSNRAAKLDALDAAISSRLSSFDGLTIIDPWTRALTAYTDPLTAGYALNRFRIGAAIVVPTPPGGIDITTLYAKSVP